MLQRIVSVQVQDIYEKCVLLQNSALQIANEELYDWPSVMIPIGNFF